MITKKRFILLLLATRFFFLPKPILAQEDLLESCFKYYQYGEVAVNLNSHKTSYLHGEKIKLSGTIVNKNSFPILGANIFTQVRRINDQNYEENGHFLVDRFTLAENLNLLPYETKQISGEYTVGINYPQGQYQLQHFVFSKDGFYYSGRPFLEEDYAGVTNFEFVNSNSEVYFDINSLTLDGQSQKIRGSIPVFAADHNPVVAVNITHPPQITNDFLVDYAWYRWDDSFEKNLIKNGQTKIQAGQTPVFQTLFDIADPGAYVLLLELKSPTRSAFKIRLARQQTKSHNLRINDLGITNYPIDPAKDKAFVCFHSPSPEKSPLTQVTLSLLGKNGQVLDQKQIKDSFGGRVMALALPLTKLNNSTTFSVQVNLENLENPALSQVLKYDYHCQLFDQSLSDLDLSFTDGKVNLVTRNLCGGKSTDSFAERIIISQDDQVIKEEYNLSPLPASIDTSSLPNGQYTLLVKSGWLEKQITFTVDRKTMPVSVNLLIAAFGVIIAGTVATFYFWKQKKMRALTLPD